jgi:hypothetical protein
MRIAGFYHKKGWVTVDTAPDMDNIYRVGWDINGHHFLYCDTPAEALESFWICVNELRGGA